MRLCKGASLFVSYFLGWSAFAGNASDFYCHAVFCVIPYDAQGVQNGNEVCYADREKKVKLKEVTWKQGQREGPARCFENGKVTVETSFHKNLLNGLSVQKNYDSTGDLITRVLNGRQRGFAFSIDKDKKMNLRGCWQDDRLDERAEKECLNGDYGPYTKQVLAEYGRLKGLERDRAAADKARRGGPQIEKYPSGAVRAQYTNKDGHRVGVYKEFFEDGKPELEENFSAQGSREGESKEWNKHGVLKRLTQYVNDIKTSETEFFDNGKPSRLVVWEGKGLNRAPCLTYYYESGMKLSSECRLPSLDYYERLHGEYVHWSESGDVSETGRYDRGLRTGVWKFFSDKRLEQEQTFVDGELTISIDYNGGLKTVREYNSDGTLKSERTTKVGGA